MREPAHNARCDRCGGPLIIATVNGGQVTLDAAEQPAGQWRAHLAAAGVDAGGEWRAVPAVGDTFWGLRRRAHVCVVPDVQLELGA